MMCFRTMKWATILVLLVVVAIVAEARLTPEEKAARKAAKKAARKQNKGGWHTGIAEMFCLGQKIIIIIYNVSSYYKFRIGSVGRKSFFNFIFIFFYFFT